MRGCSINCSCCLRRATVYSVRDLHQPSSGCEKSTCESLPWCQQLYQPTWEVYRKTHRSSGRAFDRWDFAKKIRAQYTSTLFGHVRDGGTSMIWWNVEYFTWTAETWSTVDLQLMLDRLDLMTMKKSCQDFVDTKVDARIALLSCRRCVDCQPSAGACSHFNLCRPGWMPITTLRMNSCLSVQNGHDHISGKVSRSQVFDKELARWDSRPAGLEESHRCILITGHLHLAIQSLKAWVLVWQFWHVWFAFETSLSLWRASYTNTTYGYNPRSNPAFLQHGTSFLGPHVWTTLPYPPPLQCREHEPPQHCTFFLSEGHVLKINIQRTTKKQTSTNQPAERIPLLVWTTLSLSIWPGLSNWNHVFDGSIADVPEGMQPSGFVWRVVIFIRWMWTSITFVGVFGWMARKKITTW